MRLDIDRRVGLGIGMYLVSFLVCILVLSSIVWFLGWHITPLVLILAIPLALPVFYLVGTDKKETIKAISLSIGIIVLSTIVETFVWDMSYDGNAYHQLVIYALGNGWNPVYDHHNPIISDSWSINICIDHYPKGAETMAAAFYALTGNIESGKAINLFLPIAAVFILYWFFRDKFVVSFSSKKALLYSLGIAFSMITVGQITSYYIDHFGYFTFLLTLLGVYELINEQGDKRFACWSLLSSIVISSAVKFNMLFWTGFIIACAIVALLIRKKYGTAVRLAVASAVTALVSVIVVAYNPLVTNTLDHQNPVYPLYGKEKTTTESLGVFCQPPYIYNAPRYKQIALSFFQRPTNDVTSNEYVPPYLITRTNIYRSGFCATNIGGGGLFFMEILVISLIIFIFFRNGVYYKRFTIVALLLISTLFILPMGSNFRYVPFIYIFPFLALLYLETLNKRSRPSLFAQYVLSLLLLCNISLCAGVTFATTALEQGVTMKSVRALEGKGGETFYTANWGFFNKLYHGDMEGKEPISPLLPVNQYEREKFIGGPFVYIIKPESMAQQER